MVAIIQFVVILVLSDAWFCAASMTNSWAVQMAQGVKRAEVDALAKKHGFVNLGLVANLDDMFHFQKKLHRNRRSGLRDYQQADDITQLLEAEPNVVFAEQQSRNIRQKKGYYIPNDLRFKEQWYLENTGSPYLAYAGNDNNVEGAWLQGFTGCGVTVGVVDDGVDYVHRDLYAGYAFRIQHDFLSNDSDARPEVIWDHMESHGTSCTGEIGMRKGNGLCGVGVAYNSFITGLRLISVPGSTSIQEAEALTWKNNVIDIYSNSWGPPDNGEEVEGMGRVLTSAVKKGIDEGRGGKGSIFLFAAGNGALEKDTCAADGFVSSVYTIAVGSVAVDGQQSFYDEQCSGKFVTVFTDDDSVYDGDVVTTVPDGGCVDDFIGTSASTPIASGAVALLLETNPELTWRDVQYLIAYTARTHGLVEDNWITNGAGMNVSLKFGFGALDTEALVSRGRHWVKVPDQVEEAVIPQEQRFALAGGEMKQLNISVAGSNIVFLEHVVVVFTAIFDKMGERFANGSQRGKLLVYLRSPSGTISTLLLERPNDKRPQAYRKWPLMSLHFWGETPAGEWQLVVANGNMVNENAPEYVNVRIRKLVLYGSSTVPEAVALIPAKCSEECDPTKGCAALGAEFCDACAQYRMMSTLECVSSCPEGYIARKKYCYDPTTPEPACEAAMP